MKNTYYSLIFAMFLAVCFGFKSIDSVNISYTDSINLDTIPIGQYMYDTLVVYDKDTYKSRTVVYRTKVEGYHYDTIIIFDPDTYEETIKIIQTPYGSEKELVPEEDPAEKEKKMVECYKLTWGPLEHQLVYGKTNQLIVSSKSVKAMLNSDIKFINGEDCPELTEIFSLNIIAQYDDGTMGSAAQAISAESHAKLLKSKRKDKKGTVYILNRIGVQAEDASMAFPNIQIVVR